MVSLLVIGINKTGNPEEVEIFRKLVYRNSLNFYPPQYWTLIFQENDNEETIQKEISNIIKKLEESNL